MIKQWFTLLNKEVLEMWRNFKWIWVPIVFIILGMTDPLSTYYMPQIIEAVGGLPEGTVFEMPTPSGQEVMLMSLGQLNMLGILVIVLASMGVIAAERNSGIAGVILVKPVPFGSYVSAKLVGLLLLAWFSVFIGYFASWYYTNILFEPVAFSLFLKSYLSYGFWLTFVLTLTVFYSSLFRVPGVAGFITLLTIIVLNLATSILERWMMWSPANLSGNAMSIVMTGSSIEQFWLATLTSTLIIIALLFSATKIFGNKELA